MDFCCPRPAGWSMIKSAWHAVMLCCAAGAVMALPSSPERIEVTATRTELPLAEVPAAVTVIGREDLQGLPLASLAEVLAGVPGLFVQNAGNFSQDLRIALRGFGARSAFGIRGVAIVVDGIPQTLPDGQSQVDSIDLNEIERIEILRGPASALYGNAAGGVILITTRAAGDRSSAEVRQVVGEFRRFNTAASLSGGRDRLALRLNASRLEQDGFREHSRVEQYRAGLRLGWQSRAATRVTAKLDYFEAPEEQDPGGVTAERARTAPTAANPANVRFDGGESLDQWRFGASLQHGFGADGRHALKLAGFGFVRDFENRLPFESGGQVAFERTFTGVEAQYQFDGVALMAADGRLTAGFELRRQNDDRLRFDNLEGVRGDRVFGQREKVTATGLYLQHKLDLNAAWAMTIGVRFDEVRLDVSDRLTADGDDSGGRSWNEFSPFAGLTWQVSPRWSLWANVGSGFQTPTTTELANPEHPGTGGGFNRELGPQSARNIELGARGDHGEFDWEASVFRTRIDDAIVSIEVPEFSGTGRDFFANAGSSTRNGAEVALRWKPVEVLDFGTAWTWSDFKFNRFATAGGDFSGRRLPGVPEHRLDLFGRYRTVNGTFARLDLRFVAALFANNANTATSPSYTVIDLRGGREWHTGKISLSAFFGINNLLDKRYSDNVRVNAFGGRFFEPAPDRNVFGGLGLTWN